MSTEADRQPVTTARGIATVHMLRGAASAWHEGRFGVGEGAR